MSPNDWAGLAVATISIVAGFTGAVRWLVKHYLAELKPNGGGSMNDRMTRLENRVDDIYNILLEK
jgi:hypothetical protein